MCTSFQQDVLVEGGGAADHLLSIRALYSATAELSVCAWEGHEAWMRRGSLAFAVMQGSPHSLHRAAFLTLISSVELGKVSV